MIFSLILLALFLLGYTRVLKKTAISNIGAILILLGGLSNLYEWVKIGCVRDYLNFFSMFKFNIADILVILGVVFVLINIWKKDSK